MKSSIDTRSSFELWMGPENVGNDWRSDGSLCGNLTFQVSENLLWHTANDEYNLYEVYHPTI